MNKKTITKAIDNSTKEIVATLTPDSDFTWTFSDDAVDREWYGADFDVRWDTLGQNQDGSVSVVLTVKKLEVILTRLVKKYDLHLYLELFPNDCDDDNLRFYMTDRRALQDMGYRSVEEMVPDSDDSDYVSIFSKTIQMINKEFTVRFRKKNGRLVFDGIEDDEPFEPDYFD